MASAPGPARIGGAESPTSPWRKGSAPGAPLPSPPQKVGAAAAGWPAESRAESYAGQGRHGFSVQRQ